MVRLRKKIHRQPAVERLVTKQLIESREELHIPAISIVIPVFRPNGGHLRCLFESIAQQEFKSFEIIISDDEDAEDLIKNAVSGEIGNCLCYYKNEDTKGIFGNLNSAIRKARGEFVQIFCQDDVMYPSLLADNLKYMIMHKGADMVFSAFDLIDRDERVYSPHLAHTKYIPEVITSAEANNYFLYFGCLPGNLSPVMLRQSVFTKYGYFNENYQYTGDFEYWVRIAQGSDIAYCKKPNLLIRMHNQSAASSMGTFKRYREISDIYQFLLNKHSIPFSTRVLKHYLHIQLLRSLLVYFVKRSKNISREEWRQFITMMNGDPFSIWTAIAAFVSPAPLEVRKLKMYMERSL